MDGMLRKKPDAYRPSGLERANGLPCRNRTCDLPLRRRSLYPLSQGESGIPPIEGLFINLSIKNFINKFRGMRGAFCRIRTYDLLITSELLFQLG